MDCDPCRCRSEAALEPWPTPGGATWPVPAGGRVHCRTDQHRQRRTVCCPSAPSKAPGRVPRSPAASSWPPVTPTPGRTATLDARDRCAHPGVRRRRGTATALAPRRLAAAVVSGALVAVALPPYDVWPLAPVGVARSWCCSAAASGPAAARCSGWCTGSATFVPLLSWMPSSGPTPGSARAAGGGVPGRARRAAPGRAPAARPGRCGSPASGWRRSWRGHRAVRRLPVGSARVRADRVAVHAVRRRRRGAPGDLRDRAVRRAGRGRRRAPQPTVRDRGAARGWPPSPCPPPASSLPVPARGTGGRSPWRWCRATCRARAGLPRASASRCCATTSTPRTGWPRTSGPARSPRRTSWSGRRTPPTSTRSATPRRGR